MAQPSDSASPQRSARRAFLSSSAALGAAAALGPIHAKASVPAAEKTLKVALIGCGGRGNGAAMNAAKADPNLKITVLADLFADKVEASKNILGRRLKERLEVTDDTCFTGFDAYKKVMETDVDVVLLCTTPHFRPMQLEAAIAAGKHVFCEKPVAVDAPGCRSVMETVEKAREKNLSIVSGLCWRYHPGVKATVEQIKSGMIGDIVSIQENYLAGTLWHRGHEASWSEMEYQIRNWLYFTWLSGDHNVEQHIHSLDKALWLMDDEPPAVCYGMGGREVRTEEIYGNVFDHHAVMYEFGQGTKCFAYTRQMRGCFNETEDYIMGTEGVAKVLKHSIDGRTQWQYEGERADMYVEEHKELYKGIRSGNVINNGIYMTRSTMMAIMGRMATYTGKKITWDQAWNSQQDYSLKNYEWGPVDFPNEVAVPGKTKFV